MQNASIEIDYNATWIIWYNILEGKFQMGNNNIIQLYPKSIINYNQQMPVEQEKITLQQVTPNVSELRLLSIYKSSKILGIRYETVQKLVRTGKIKAVLVNNRYKIPYKSILEFEDGSNELPVAKPTITIEETQNRIDNLLKEYSG